MRTPIIAGILGAFLAGCLSGEISDVGDEGDGDGSGSDTGSNGQTGRDPGEGGGDTTQPRATLSVDKATVTSDLNVEQAITITATSAMGFTGDVTLTVTADNGGTAITDWTTTLASTTLSIPVDASVTTTLKVSALGDTKALTGNLKVTATAGANSTSASVAVTFNPVLVVTFNDSGAGKCVYPVNRGVNTPWLLTQGRQIKVINGSTTLGLQVHTNGSVAGFPHENVVQAPGEAYLRTVTKAGDVDEFYCHTGANTMTEQGGSVRNYLRVVAP